MSVCILYKDKNTFFISIFYGVEFHNINKQIVLRVMKP